ncbi:hypothetical protein NQ318_010313 [Aromia moschata]|uniref:LITAF domain-containing protein n=1 Tax=Aromia moschata TaxID=1265417 RepID=A0AAV8XK15_9CUCU|nr:hypothetical protein NQ318_010313 [Aromia moschata]
MNYCNSKLYYLSLIMIPSNMMDSMFPYENTSISNSISHYFYLRVMKGPEIVTTVVAVGPNPTHMICPHCEAEIDTTTKSTPGVIAYVSSAILCIIGRHPSLFSHPRRRESTLIGYKSVKGCFLGCCLIPCCIDSCMDVSHTCPNCGAYLGTFKR